MAQFWAMQCKAHRPTGVNPIHTLDPQAAAFVVTDKFLGKVSALLTALG